MKVKVTIKSNSKASKMFSKYIAEKEAFKKAVREGDIANYAKQHPTKFATPVRVK